MKTKIMYALFLLAITTLLALRWNTESVPFVGLDNPPSEGPHGGIVKNAEGYYIEMKNNPDTSFFTYLLNKKLKTIPNKDISGEVKFFFPDSTVMDVQLNPAAKNSFTAKTAPVFYACKITFHISGKDVSALFEKQSQIVQQK